MYQRPDLFRPGIVAVLTLFADSLFGGVVLDGSFGTKGSLPSINNNFTIQSNFGKQVGGNLFQSFSQFNLSKPQSATFRGPSNVQNILARVTSGSPSSIDGTIKVDPTMGDANLFFMNPAGVLFGKNAQLDVKGSFAVTTANYLNLVGGGRFNANLGGGDVLTSAPVSAFGFLNSTPAAVSIIGSNNARGFENGGFVPNIVPGPGLTIAPQKSFSIVGGDIAMNASTIAGEGSRVNLVSVKSPGEVHLDATNINSAVDVSPFTALGRISLSNLALIDTSGPGGGPVVIRGGNLYLDNSEVLSATLGSNQGETIDIAVTQSMRITAGGLISANAFGKSVAGDVTLTADSLLIDGISFDSPFTGILAIAEFGSSGDAGSITVHAGNLKIIRFGEIRTDTFGKGNAGDLTVTGNSLLIYYGAGIFADSSGDNSGDAGSVVVRAGNLTLTLGGSINLSSNGTGNAGDLTVTANSLLLDDGLITADAFAGGGRFRLAATPGASPSTQAISESRQLEELKVGLAHKIRAVERAQT